MTVARDMIKQLGLDIYAEGLNKMVSGTSTAWVRYDLPARDNPFQFTLQKVYGDPCLQDVDASENIGKKLIRQIMQETGYDVDDINYSFCDEIRQHFIELHHIAGGATLMAHWARERERTAVDSLDK